MGYYLIISGIYIGSNNLSEIWMKTQLVTNSNNARVDVIVLGGSLSATVTALTLSAQGLKVALLDSGQHPRFALGESLLKPTVYWMRLLSLKYQVPQLDILANVDKIFKAIGPTSGIKKCFGFVQHQANQDFIKDKWWSNIPINYEEDISEAHLFRQDIDSYMFNECVKACHLVKPGINIDSIDIGSSEVTVCAGTDIIKSKYIVDATSSKSILANQFALRDSPTRLKSKSRTIFTHMINVKKYDDCPAAEKAALSWHEGTLHHLLEEGWIWVIPFDNHPQSKNALVSVGMSFINQTEKSNKTAQQEWNDLLEKYPVLNQQFSQATPVRPWVSTGRLQYSSKSSTGERYCLLGQSYGGVDALFSRGLLNTLQSIYLTVDKVATACKENNFAKENFVIIDELQADLLEINDLLTYGNYCASGSTLLTTWWLSIWTLVEQNSIAHVYGSLLEVMENPDIDWKIIDERYSQGQAISQQKTIQDFLNEAVSCMEIYQNGDIGESEAGKRLQVLSVPFEKFGFRFENYQNLLTLFGFNSSAGIVLQAEHDLVYLIEIIDNQLHSTVKLKKQPLIKYIIRLLTQKIHKARCRDNTKEIMFDSQGDSLYRLLTEIESKWQINTPFKSTISKKIKKLHCLSYLSLPIKHSIIQQKRKTFTGMFSLINFQDSQVNLSVYVNELTDNKLECVVLSEVENCYQEVRITLDRDVLEINC